VNAMVMKVKSVWQVRKASEQSLDSNLVHSHDIDHLYQGIPPHSRRVTAISKIVDAVLFRILEGTTKLPDITVDESRRPPALRRAIRRRSRTAKLTPLV
jgi:hypothetical protein